MERDKAIYVDVDGTLGRGQVVNAGLVEWLRQQRASGARLFLWSAAGDQHARAAANAAGVSDLFEAILPKPSAVVDDRGWGWVRYVPVIRGPGGM